MAAVTFTVDQAPVPKARPRLAANGHTYTPQRTVEYERAIGWAWKAAAGAQPPLTGNVRLLVTVYEGGRAADWDNYGKICSDALNGLAWEDDVQVVEAHVRVYRKAANPRLEVEVQGIDEVT